MRVARRVPAILAVAIITTLVAPVASEAAAPPAARSAGGSGNDVRRSKPHQPHRPTGRLQVRFKDGVGARGQEAALGRATAKGHAIGVAKRSSALNAALLKVSNPVAVQRLLRQDPSVAYVEAESTYRPFAADPSTPERDAVGLPSVAARDADTALTGAGTEIAIIDSIVDAANPDLAGKVTVAVDLTTDIPASQEPDQADDLPCDPERCPHGTGVAAVAAAADDNGGMVGAAPGANIASYNVFRRFLYTDPQTFEQWEDIGASSFDIAAALTAVKDRAATTPGLVAVNMSLGGTFDNQLVRDALAALRAAAPRVVVVVAAGNDGGERANFPAGDPGVLSVGASGQGTDDDACGAPSSTAWNVASFSNRGDVDVIAPGHCVTTWYRPESATVGGQHAGARELQAVDGTSFSAPMVAGVVALLGEAGATGDAARAAIVAGATQPATPNVNVGVGSLDVPASVALVTGTAAYTAAFLDRGGQIANTVGRRDVEVLQVQPGTTPTAPAQAVPTVGRGTLTGAVTGTSGGVRRTTYKYAPPAANQGTVSFSLNAGATKVPIRLIDAGDNFEGLPAANGEKTSVPLSWGTRSAHIRSVSLPAGAPLDYSYTYGDSGVQAGDPDVPPSSDLFIWEPLTSGGTADAAFEPVWQEMGPEYVGVGGIDVEVSGRHLIGWLLFSPEDNSSATSRYELTLSYAGPGVALNAPALASNVSSTGPFKVIWGGTGGVRFDVEYTTKVKSGTSWVLGTWKPWLMNTTAKSGVFGASNLPVALAKGQTYHFRVRSYDLRQNPSLYTSKFTVVPLDNAYYAFAYAGTWAKGGATGRWANNVHYSGTRNASLTVKSETSQFTIIGDKCSTCGQMKVYIDGVYKATVDTRAGGTYVRSVLWTSPNLGAPKPRTLKLVVVGTAGRPRVIIDAIGSLR